MADEEAGSPGKSEDNFGAVRTLFKGGGVVLAGVVLEIGISFVGKLLVARGLGRADYGSVSLGIITAAIASTLLLLGLREGVGRFLPRDDDVASRRSVLLSAVRIVVPLSILAGVSLVLVAPFLATSVFGDRSLTAVFQIFAVAIPFGVIMKLALGGVQGMRDTFPKVAIQNVTFPVVRIAGIVAALSLGAGVVGVSFAYLASYFAAGIGGIYYLYSRTPLFDFDVPTQSRGRELLSFSFPLIVTTAMTIVLSDIDMYMLGILKGTSPVGVYNVVYPLAELLTIALTSFGFLFMPLLSEFDASGKHDQMTQLYQIVTKWIVVGTLPLFLVFVAFPQWVILYTFGEEYVVGATALSVMSVGFFAHTAFGLNKGALMSLGYTRLLMYDDILAAGVNVILNLVLIPRMGLLGAAYATTASYILLNALYSYQLYTRNGIHPLTRSLVIPPVLATGIMAIIYVFGRTYVQVSPASLFILFVIFACIYGAAVLRFGIDAEEVRLVLSFEERFGVDLGPLKRLANRFM